MNSKDVNLLVPLLFLVMSCCSCAKSPEATKSQVGVSNHEPSTINLQQPPSLESKLTSEGDILVVKDKGDGITIASLISLSEGDESVKLNRVIQLLKFANADADFIEKILPRLKSNRQLKKVNFNLPLVDESGRQYLLNNTYDEENQLIVLNLEFLKN